MSDAEVKAHLAKSSIEANAEKTVIPSLFMTSLADEQAPRVLVKPGFDKLKAAGGRANCPCLAGTKDGVLLGAGGFTVSAGMLGCSSKKAVCRPASIGPWCWWTAWAIATWAALASAAVVKVQDEGTGNDYMSGQPITLPAAQLSTNLFGNGVQCIINRPHCVKPVAFNALGDLDLWVPTGERGHPAASRFPVYLEGQQYVWFLQDVRHYTNYACNVTVDCPSAFYLLVDNRVNEFGDGKSYTDPVFGPPDTEWIRDDGWERVNTGLTPRLTATNQGDYVAIDEGCNGTLNQVYAVYRRILRSPGLITLRTQFEGDMYCLVVSTNLPDGARPEATPGHLSPPGRGQNAGATGHLKSGGN